jgi:hypothetical protein
MGIYKATESRSFNEAMNALAGTKGVTYSEQWPMHIRNGEDFMGAYHASVGRVYADELLHNRIGTHSVLALHGAHDDLNNKQRALLTGLVDTKSTVDFDDMLRACILGNAAPTTAGIYFTKYSEPHFRSLYAGNQGLPPIDYAALVSATSRKLLAASIQPRAQATGVMRADAAMEAVRAPSPAIAKDTVRAQSPAIMEDIVMAQEPSLPVEPPLYAVQSPPRAPAVHINPPGSSTKVKLKALPSGKRRKGSGPKQ